jgi:hypothetical protein
MTDAAAVLARYQARLRKRADEASSNVDNSSGLGKLMDGAIAIALSIAATELELAIRDANRAAPGAAAKEM